MANQNKKPAVGADKKASEKNLVIPLKGSANKTNKIRPLKPKEETENNKEKETVLQEKVAKQRAKQGGSSVNMQKGGNAIVGSSSPDPQKGSTAKNQKQGKNKTKTTASNLSKHAAYNMERARISAANNVKEKAKPRPTSRKTQGLVNKIKQSNIKQIEKQKSTRQKKESFNLNYMLDGDHSHNSNNVQGIIKKTDSPVVAVSKNNSVNIRANVIGKKSDLKIIANKSVIFVCSILVVLLVCSLFVNYLVYNQMNFKLKNPPITITKNIQLKIKDNSTEFASLTLPRNVLTDLEMDQKVSVYAEVLNDSQIVRAKAMFTTGDGAVEPPTIKFDHKWVVSEDGYAYYNDLLKTGQLVQVVKAVTTPQEMNLEEDGVNLNVLTFIFESISVSDISVAKQLWKGAPQNYFDDISALV